MTISVHLAIHSVIHSQSAQDAPESHALSPADTEGWLQVTWYAEMLAEHGIHAQSDGFVDMAGASDSLSAYSCCWPLQ